LAQLSQEMKSGSPAREVRYFVSLPTCDAHTKHPTDETSGYAQKVHPAIAQKISEIVSDGTVEIHEVKRSLRNYVHTQFSKRYQCQPSPSDRAFHPSLQDIRNHVHKAKKALELSKLDKENLHLMVKKREQEQPSSRHFYRPYIMADKSQLPKTGSRQGIQPSGFQGNLGGDDEWNELVGSHTDCSQTFLWVHQTDWQKSLLARYGNNISMILHCFLCVCAQMLDTVLLASSLHNQKRLSIYKKLCRSYKPGIQGGSPSSSCATTPKQK